jgi:hypothetical protein
MKITRFGLRRISVVMAITVTILFLMKHIGFLFATLIYIFIVMTYLRERRLLGRTFVSVGIAVSVYVLFRYVMVIPLPEFTLCELS